MQHSPPERSIHLQPKDYDSEPSTLITTSTNQSLSLSPSPHAPKTTKLIPMPKSPTLTHLRSKSCPENDDQIDNDATRKRHLSPYYVGEDNNMYSRDTSTDEEVPLAYRYTSSTLSPHSGSEPLRVMSEVERKKKMRSMKQKVKRSASASRIEDIKSTTPPVSPNTQRKLRPKTPPGRLSGGSSLSRGSSEESVDLKRKQLISDKVAELKRIRDLAKAYAEGEPPVNESLVSGGPNQSVISNQADYDIANPHPTIVVQPSNTKSNKMVSQQPLIRNAKTQSPKPVKKQPSPQKGGDRFALPDFNRPEGTTRQHQYDGLRQMNVSRYDNDSCDELETLPKFPVPQSVRDSSSIYSNVPTRSNRSAADSKVNEDIKDVISAINSSNNFWNRNVDAVEVLSPGNCVTSANATNSLTRECAATILQPQSVNAHCYNSSNEGSDVSDDIIEADVDMPEDYVCYSHVLSLPEHASLHEVVSHCSYDLHGDESICCDEAMVSQTSDGGVVPIPPVQPLQPHLDLISHQHPNQGRSYVQTQSNPHIINNQPSEMPVSHFLNSTTGEGPSLHSFPDNQHTSEIKEQLEFQVIPNQAEYVYSSMKSPPLFCFTPHPLDNMYTQSESGITRHSYSSLSLSGLSSNGEKYCTSSSASDSTRHSLRSPTFTETIDELTHLSENLNTAQSLVVSRVPLHHKPWLQTLSTAQPHFYLYCPYCVSLFFSYPPITITYAAVLFLSYLCQWCWLSQSFIITL